MLRRLALFAFLLVSTAVGARADLGGEVERARQIADSERRDALARLLALYRSPPAPREHLREQIAPLIAFTFGRGDQTRTFLEAFEDDLGEPEHAWLAYQVFLEWMAQRRADRVRLAVTILTGHPFHRAAGLRALAGRATEDDKALARQTLSELPDEEVARAVLTEAAAQLLLAGWDPPTDLEHDPTFLLLVTRFDDPAMLRRTRLVLGRMLARALESDTVYLTADAWRGVAERRRTREQLAREGYHPGSNSVPTFMGIAAAGRDICYVLDVSGSMATPIAGKPSTRRGGGQLPRRGPTTGRRLPLAPTPNDDTPDDKDAFRGLEDLPWAKIHTRLDLVREALKASLRSLDEDQRFAVVLFSDAATPLAVTRRPLRATKENVRRACKAVDGLSASGGTNLHRGLELGFAMTEGGLSFDHPSVNEDHLLTGLDTIFVLTDGEPNLDSYSAPPSSARGRPGGAGSALYAEPKNILLGTARMNLFRRCEIHCIGMGSSARRLLQDLARQGHGQARFLGY